MPLCQIHQASCQGPLCVNADGNALDFRSVLETCIGIIENSLKDPAGDWKWPTQTDFQAVAPYMLSYIEDQEVFKIHQSIRNDPFIETWVALKLALSDQHQIESLETSRSDFLVWVRELMDYYDMSEARLRYGA